jgi:hypothetical protein
MAGLKDIWGLGDPAALDPQIAQRFEKEIKAFSAVLQLLNESLRTTAVDAVPANHDKLVQGRDALIARYQKALVASDGTSIKEVLGKAELLAKQAAQMADAASAAKAQWEKQATTLDATAESVALSASEGADVTRTQQGLGQIAEAVKQRNYQAACDLLAGLSSSVPAASGASSAPGGPEQRYSLGGKLPADPVVPLDPAALASWNNPLVTGDPRELFTEERMDAIVEMEFAGAGSKELNAAMKGLLFAKPGDDVSQHLAAIGKQRGLDPQVVQVQYERFQQVRGVAGQLETARGLPTDEVMTTRQEEYLQVHGEFLGNSSSLRFGQVVGEATGLDPAFAAMLNPTGGMVGPGMDVLAPTEANSPVIWHGIFHDAGGYLLNYQNSGPGYTYLASKQPESGRRGADPLQGQVEGISYWYERKQPNRSILEDLYEFDSTAADPAKKELMYDRYVKHPIDDAESIANNLTTDAVEDVRELAGDAREFNRDAVKSLKGSTSEAADAVQAEIDEAQQSVDEFSQKARDLGVNKELVSVAQAAIKTELRDAHSKVEAWEQGLLAAFDATGKFVDDQLASVDQWAEESGAALRQDTAGLADDLEESVHGELVELAQDQDLQQTLQTSINKYAETQQDVTRLIETASADLEKAKGEVVKFYDAAVATASAGVGRVERELTGVKNNLIDKISKAQKLANRVVDDMVREVDGAMRKLAKSGQEILDTAVDLQDSLDDAVGGGTDTLAHTQSSATDFAAGSLDRLTKLLG